MASRHIVPVKRSLAEAWRVDDDWTAVEAGRERKKIQNRLNQRAKRRRTDPSKERSRKLSFHIDRWRVNELATPRLSVRQEILPASIESTLTIDDVNQSALDIVGPSLWDWPHFDPIVDRSMVDSSLKLIESNLFKSITQPMSDYTATSQTCLFTLPLSSDHLLHLIHHNVFRAIVSIKNILSITTTLTKPNIIVPITPSTANLCDGLTLIHPVANNVPPWPLHPSNLQMTYPHPSWMNLFPCAPLRDRLIGHAGNYDDIDFLHDLVGDMFSDGQKPILPSLDPHSTSFTEPDSTNSEEDDLTYKRKGLLVWGDPWDVNNWEVTPGFIRKWGWLLEGCEDLITASNRWRAKRNEEPLPQIVLQL